MKRIVFLLLLAIIGCQKSAVDIAKKEVQEAVKLKLNEPSKYKAITWGTLDSVFAEPLDIIRNKYGVNVYLDPTDFLWYKLKKEKIVNVNGRDIIQISGKFYYLNYTKINTQLKKEPGLTFDQFVCLIKNKYPEYKDQDNKKVAREVFKKYPVYINQVDTTLYEKRNIHVGYNIEHAFRIQDRKKTNKLVKYLFTLDLKYKYISHVEKPVNTFD
jgi:hypothetical protein